MRRRSGVTTALLIGTISAAFVALGSGCASISTDDLTFTNGIFVDHTGRAYTGTARLTVTGMEQTGIGMSPTTATVPCKLKIQDGRVVAMKNSGSPLAPWIRLPDADPGAVQRLGSTP